jgi:DNA helicase-2/ATP-dependent DNA helicase PcrA
MNETILSIEQSIIVNSKDRHRVVVAGAGTGKTTTLVADIKEKLNEDNISRFMIITFTNKSAKEIQSRLKVKSRYCGTFHSVFYKLYLDYFSSAPDIEPDPKSILRDLDVDIATNDIVRYISLVKNSRQCSEKELAKKVFGDLSDEQLSSLRKICRDYDNKRIELNLWDFDDILLQNLNKIESDNEYKQFIQGKFKYIYVDEYQDTNSLQQELLDTIVNEDTNTFYVGDPAQSIYGFRGSNVSSFLDIINRGDYRHFFLSGNYRSQNEILKTTNKLLKYIWKQFDNSKPELLMSYLKIDKSSNVALNTYRSTHKQLKDIENWIAILSKYGVPANDIAIICRTNSQLETVYNWMSGHNSRIPVVVCDSRNFMLDKHNKMLVDIMKFIFVNSKFSYLRRPLLELPSIGEKTVNLLSELNYKDDWSEIKDNLKKLNLMESRHSEAEKFFTKLYTGIERLSKLQTLSNDVIVELLLYYDKELNYVYRRDKKSERDFEKLLLAVKDRDENEPVLTFFNEILLVDNTSMSQEDINAVKLMTIHSSKGLEFDTVFYPAVSERFSKKDMSSEEFREELRLTYVACTRAKRKLYISHADNIALPYGIYHDTLPLAFIEMQRDQQKETSLLGI